jgi:hypothetical protein
MHPDLSFAAAVEPDSDIIAECSPAGRREREAGQLAWPSTFERECEAWTNRSR